MAIPGSDDEALTGASAPAPQWLDAEPFRLFFISGAVWSLVGVTLWPLYYWGQIGFYPHYCHARLMIEAFGGAFVVGFLGTAGPRLASAPKLVPFELAWLFLLHQASSLCHLLLKHTLGDALFVLLLVSLLGMLGVRILRHWQDTPPPQMLLALAGLACAAFGASLSLLPSTLADLPRSRLAGLLLYQGLLLLPLLGIGSYLFPRILGGTFGEPTSPYAVRRSFTRAAATGLIVVGSFFVEAFVHAQAGILVRAAAAAAYLLVEIHWRRPAATPARGSLATGLAWALCTGLAGLVLAAFFLPQRIAIEHLLYIGGFGLLMLIVGSRVLFGHSGDLAGFDRRTGFRRLLIFIGIFAAATRAIPAWFPQLAFSHHQYAALMWALLVLLWLAWHRRRFVQREDDA